MGSLKTVSMDIVKHILPYDMRFVIRKGEIVVINKLDENKYKPIIDLLKNKPKIKVTRHQPAFRDIPPNRWWCSCIVKFSNNLAMSYEIGYVGPPEIRRQVIHCKFGTIDEYWGVSSRKMITIC
jgi:hypothetical protein